MLGCNQYRSIPSQSRIFNTREFLICTSNFCVEKQWAVWLYIYTIRICLANTEKKYVSMKRPSTEVDLQEKTKRAKGTVDSLVRGQADDFVLLLTKIKVEQLGGGPIVGKQYTSYSLTRSGSPN